MFCLREIKNGKKKAKSFVFIENYILLQSNVFGQAQQAEINEFSACRMK
jgi:hypothetical protein